MGSHNLHTKGLWLFISLSKMVWSGISFASFSMMVEGTAAPPFKNHRGIRQGDPLSSILFDMVMV